MVNVIMIRNTYGGLEYLRKGCFYVTNHARAIAPGGFGVNYTDAVACYQNMLAVKQFYHKTSDNPLLHIVVSYNNCVQDILTAARLSAKIATFFTGYQYVYCTHFKDRECSHFHMHLVINSVSYIDGHLISSWLGNLHQFCGHVAAITHQSTWLSIKTKTNDFED